MTRKPAADRLAAVARVLRLYLLLKKKARTLAELEELLGVSAPTLRRDLAVLDQVGREEKAWHIEDQGRPRVVVLVERPAEKP